MTLLEAIIWLSVFVVILTAIVSSLRYTYRGQRFAFEQADATRSARVGIERSVRDFREASYADNGAYPIVSLATSTATFYSDYDNDDKIERVRYFLDGTTLKRGITESSGDPAVYATSSESVSTLSTDVRNTAINTPLFTYFDRAGAAMADLSDVDALAFVVVRLVVNLHPERAPDDFELRSSAALRNVR